MIHSILHILIILINFHLFSIFILSYCCILFPKFNLTQVPLILSLIKTLIFISKSERKYKARSLLKSLLLLSTLSLDLNKRPLLYAQSGIFVIYIENQNKLLKKPFAKICTIFCWVKTSVFCFYRLFLSQNTNYHGEFIKFNVSSEVFYQHFINIEIQ